MEKLYFQYGDKETDYLKSKDKRLAQVIERVGHIYREINPDLFSSIVRNIVAQQISSKAFVTVWRRMEEGLGTIDAKTLMLAGAEKIQSFGISFRKTDYILDFAVRVDSGDFVINDIPYLSDEEVIEKLVKLKGIGRWTAEMLLLFCLQRPNVFAYDDLAIQRGLMTVQHHRKMTGPLFEKYRRRYSPYCSVASLYFWAVAGDAEIVTRLT